MKKLNKEKIDQEIFEILHSTFKVIGIRPTERNIQLAHAMFIEGINYWREKTQ